MRYPKSPFIVILVIINELGLFSSLSIPQACLLQSLPQLQLPLLWWCTLRRTHFKKSNCCRDIQLWANLWFLGDHIFLIKASIDIDLAMCNLDILQIDISQIYAIFIILKLNFAKNVVDNESLHIFELLIAHLSKILHTR